jgi:hypothetical protein
MTALSRASSSLPDHETTMTDVVKMAIKVSMAIAMFTIMLIVIALPILAIVSKFAMLAKITTFIAVLMQPIIASFSIVVMVTMFAAEHECHICHACHCLQIYQCCSGVTTAKVQ